MKRLFVLLALLASLGCQETVSELPTELPTPDNRDILMKLQDIPGMTVTELPATAHFNRLFEIGFTQPVDHNNPSGPTFVQKIYIGHVDEELPVVFETEGYSRDDFRMRELAPAMACNQITVEHRYNGSSRPNPTDWQFLNIKQAADDHHQIVQRLKNIYNGSWVSSGRSKGGDTAIFHRRFYPDDVDATVAFVAPILFSQDDQRINAYLSSAGDEECREKVKAFQRSVLLKADSLVSLMPGLVSWVNTNFDTEFTYSISYETVVKHAAAEYPFEFWSSDIHDCASIPEATASAQELLDHLVEVVNIFLFYSDYGFDFWQAWYYQAQTEIGNYQFDTEHIEDLLGEFESLGDLYNFGEALTFDPSAMQDIDQWVKTEGDRIIFVYGEDDPWTATPFEISNLDVLRIINPGTKHGTAISDLSADNQALVKEKLSAWLNYDEYTFCEL